VNQKSTPYYQSANQQISKSTHASFTSFLNQPGLPLGLRNNNPGNLRPGIAWQGATGTNQGFLVFKDIAWGIRAMATDIGNDIRIDGSDTLTKLIHDYAPPSENDTIAYINTVSRKTGITPNEKIEPTVDNLKKIIRAQMEVELGTQYAAMVSDADIDEGLALMSSPLKSFFKNITENPEQIAIQSAAYVKRNPVKVIVVASISIAVAAFALNRLRK